MFLYAPGLRTREEVQAVCQAVSRPVNVLALPGMSMTEIVEAGARRVSVGGGLTWVAVDAMVGAATAIRERGDFGPKEGAALSRMVRGCGQPSGMTRASTDRGGSYLSWFRSPGWWTQRRGVAR